MDLMPYRIVTAHALYLIGLRNRLLYPYRQSAFAQLLHQAQDYTLKLVGFYGLLGEMTAIRQQQKRPPSLFDWKAKKGD